MVVGHRKLFTDVALFTMAQDAVYPILLEVERPMEGFRLDSRHRESFVEALEEPGQECVDVVALQRAVGSLHATLGLTGICADDLDVQLGHCTSELRHARTTLRIRLVDSKNRVPE